MIPLNKGLSSSVGKKFLVGLTGLAWVLFVIAHLLGNLSLYFREGTTFNKYAAALEGLGGLIVLAEVGLIAALIIHVLFAVSVTRTNKAARPTGYAHGLRSKGGPSKNTVGSRNMIITGVVLLAFVIIHVWQFKFGPGVAEGYMADLGGHQGRDLYRLVVETFQNPIWALFYVTSMLLLGFHLRHGFWSAFQSLGLNNPRISASIYGLALILALLLSVGFLFIPIWIYFGLGGMFT